jgi:glycosyltransferase involved in cell wall biosynthesis
MPSVSVVLVTYNRGRLLARTLDTILAQTFRDFELIVCDDCSPDDTPEVVRRYQRLDSRIVYRRNERNLRMPENMNQGIRQARGEYIANLHDGDLYDPELLEKWKGALDGNPEAAFVFNQYGYITDDELIWHVEREELPEVFPGSRLLEGTYYKRWRFGSPVWGTVMARRRLYEKEGYFDPRYGWIADVDMWLRLAEKYQVAYIDAPLIRMWTHDQVPQQFQLDGEHAMVHRMFFESRMRFYRGRPVRRLLEAGRHGAFVTAHNAYLLLLRLNAILRAKARHS